MEDLDDNMLTQILVRLPNSETVIACSPVNKRWYSLISDPNFQVGFSDHKNKTTTLLTGSGSNIDDDEPPWSLIRTTYSWEQPLITESVFGSRKLSLQYMLGNYTFIIKATFKDLVLTHQENSRVYYITNPITKQWIALPPCPRVNSKTQIRKTVLMCQPPYSHTQDYKFRVVEARLDNSIVCTYDLVVYCSEIGEWKKINLRVPKKAGPLKASIEEPEIVACNGIIYFKSGLCLVGLDPFDVNDACDMTLEARAMPPLPDFGFLTESSGQLLVMHTRDGMLDRSRGLWYREHEMAIELEMVVWKLDLNQAPLVWEMTFEGLCKGTRNSIEFNHQHAIVKVFIAAMNILVHPFNDKLIYIFQTTGEQFLLCDTQTRCITFSDKFPYYSRLFHRLEHQWWPTLVPALAQCLPDSWLNRISNYNNC